MVQELIPTGYEYVSSVATKGTYTQGDGLWNVALLDPGATEELKVVAVVLNAGDYLNTATIVSADGGVDGAMKNNTFQVTVTPICIKVFNEFSPNGDGVNDLFIINCIETFPDNKLEVYDRWGNVVYEKRGYNNEWNGTLQEGKVTLNKSSQLSSSTYYYVLDLGDGSKPRVGWLYINR